MVLNLLGRRGGGFQSSVGGSARCSLVERSCQGLCYSPGPLGSQGQPYQRWSPVSSPVLGPGGFAAAA